MTDDQKLRIELRTYQARLRDNQAMALTYLPSIKSLCQTLGLDWEVLTGITNGYIFNLTVSENDLTVKEVSQKTEQNPEITVTTHYNGYCLNPNCQKDLSNRRKGTKYCNQTCKNKAYEI